MKKIWYHGTSKKNAKLILKTGFKKETWFARNLQDAIAYGGSYVFEVMLDIDETDKESWQICHENKVKIKYIISLTHYYIQILFEDDELRKRVKED
jgi:hypothetical protein